ncbi:MAG: sigma-70 family RNA polymerase sigma factor [Phycisphaerales bacterium]|nr:sigma-70 family RNA polymerase sigma factor [Phycisphaerales bacterium]
MLASKGFPQTRPSLLYSLRDDEPPQSAWRDFFECYAPAVMRVARLRGLNVEDADDVVQTVMLDVAKHIGTFRYDRDRGRFRQWIRRITESKICDFLRRQRTARKYVSPVPVDDFCPATPDAVWDEQWRLQDMRWCLNQMALDVSPRRMQAFQMYVLDGVSAADTATSMGMTAGHVYVIRSQMLGELRERMARLKQD